VGKPFRLLLLAAAFLISSVAPSGEAGAEKWGTEFTPYAGYHVGGSFNDNTTGADLDIGEGGMYGLIFNLTDPQENRYELFYGFQRTEVTGGGTFGGGRLFDLDIHYIHVGGAYDWTEGKIRPYVAGGVGATHFSPRGNGMDPKTYFSFSLGVGARMPISDHVGLRIEGRGFLTILPDSTEIFCVSSDGAACQVNVQGDAFGQFLLLTGITFSL